jgi:hypothetical protein
MLRLCTALLLTIIGFAPRLSAQVNVWTGQFSSEWHLAANWSNGQPPSADSDLFIDPSADFSPEIGLSAMTCNKLVMPLGSHLTVLADGELQVDTFLLEGSLLCSGRLTANLLDNLGEADIMHNASATFGLLLRNGGRLTNLGTIVCHGDFENNYRLQNRGEMVLRANYSDFSPHALNPIVDYGHIHFQSPSPTPNSSNGRNKFNYITIEDIAGRQASGSPMLVGGGLELVRGVLYADQPVTLSDSATVSGGSDLSFVQGTLRRNSRLRETLVFPIGANGIYRPVQLIRRNAAPGVFAAAAFGEGYRNLSTVPTELDSVSSQEFWSVSGTESVDMKIFAPSSNGIDFQAEAPRLVLSGYSTAHGWSSIGADAMDFYERSIRVDDLLPSGFYTFGYALPQVPLIGNEGTLEMELLNAPDNQVTVADIHLEEPATIVLELYSLLGQLLYHEKVSAQAENIRILVPTSDLPRGNYVLRASSSGAQVSRLVTKL